MRSTLKQKIKKVKKYMNSKFFDIIKNKLETYRGSASDKAMHRLGKTNKIKKTVKKKDDSIQEIVRQAYEETIFGMSLEEYLMKKKTKLSISEGVKKVREIIDYVTSCDVYLSPEEIKERINESLIHLTS